MDIFYIQTTNINALDQIKFTKFISVIPTNIRVKLHDEYIKDYKTAVQRIQIL